MCNIFIYVPVHFITKLVPELCIYNHLDDYTESIKRYVFIVENTPKRIMKCQYIVGLSFVYFHIMFFIYIITVLFLSAVVGIKSIEIL